jgi:hypothetical protein
MANLLLPLSAMFVVCSACVWALLVLSWLN